MSLRPPLCGVLTFTLNVVPLIACLSCSPSAVQALRKGRWSAEQKKASLAAQGENAEAAVSLGDVKAFVKRLFHR